MRRLAFTALLLTLATTSFATIHGKISAHVAALYLQPNSNNLKYAVLVSGQQPYYQSWHNQSISPGYSPALDLGIDYRFQDSDYSVMLDWLHADTSDSSSKHAQTGLSLIDVQFVAPPYDVGPAVFGIKEAKSNVQNDFNSVLVNVGKVFAYGDHVRGKMFGGINILTINQNLSTTFRDFRGYPEITGQAYALPPDPRFYFTTSNTSDYTGAGPDLGVELSYVMSNGFGISADFLGTLTVGSVSAADNFTSASRRLFELGILTSTQRITAPNTTQVVPGLDTSLGLTYQRQWYNMNVALELGYRLAYYMNAIYGIYPDTLVQAGTDPTIPEFATGTMAINSTSTSSSPFSLSGPFLELTISLI